MKIAVVDLGTNTFNLLIVEVVENRKFKKIYSDRIAVKLGEDTINKGIISPKPFQRGITALHNFKDKINEHNVGMVKAYATSAIRTAINGNDFIAAAWNEVAIKVEIIDGNREAELIFSGVSMGVDLPDKPVLIMDIGGGSTEFIISRNKKIVWKKSYTLGVARIANQFNPEDPIHIKTIEAINNFLHEELKDLIEIVKQEKPALLIGSSGAFDSFVDMIAAEKGTIGITENIHKYPVELNEFRKMYEKTVPSTTSQRLQMKGLLPMRVDMIVISFLLTKFILHSCSIQNFLCSIYSLKEGVIAEMMEELNNTNRI